MGILYCAGHCAEPDYGQTPLPDKKEYDFVSMQAGRHG